jgi:enoyl-CoA hydratase/carnithine racemase
MSDIFIRKEGKAGRITLTRPRAMNALTYQMVLDIEAATDAWASDDEVALVVIDAEGDRAFCAGGDITQMFDTASEGDFDYGRQFWRDEYRLNAKIFNYPKPYVALMQGYTMGGGVGVSCLGTHRVVGESSRIAMPECGIGLVPDVGGSLLLARAPGRMGEYLGTTGHRMGPGDAIVAGFADCYVPEDRWADLVVALEETGDSSAVDQASLPAPETTLDRDAIDAHFAGETAADIVHGLPDSEWGHETAKLMRRGSPISVACTVEIVRRVRAADTITFALGQEYRFTSRSASEGDFIEGIRAAVIDKDKNPRWRHARLEDVTAEDVARMLMPTGDDLNLGG